MKRLKTIVTGGAGFIGSHIVDRLLADNHKVVVIDNYSTGRPENLNHVKDNKNLLIVNADINDSKKVEKYFKEVDWVFHMAALADIVPSIQRPERYFRSNVDGTLSVLQLSKKAGIKRFIYAASSSCYGIPDIYPTPETAEIRTEYPYALTKYLGEQMVLHWGKVYKFPVISLRFFNAYGLRSRTLGAYGAVFGVFLSQKIHGKPYTVVGDGNQTRDFTFVTDIVDSCVTAAGSDITGEIINIGSGNTYSINRLVELLGGDVVHIPKRPGEPNCTFADISNAKKLLNYKPKVKFEEGVNVMLDHIDYWKDAPVWTSGKIKEATKDWFLYLSK